MTLILHLSIYEKLQWFQIPANSSQAANKIAYHSHLLLLMRQWKRVWISLQELSCLLLPSFLLRMHQLEQLWINLQEWCLNTAVDGSLQLARDSWSYSWQNQPVSVDSFSHITQSIIRDTWASLLKTGWLDAFKSLWIPQSSCELLQDKHVLQSSGLSPGCGRYFVRRGLLVNNPELENDN